MTRPTVYVDADDFHETNHDLAILRDIRRRNPTFRVTLFTVPALCSPAFLEAMKAVEWVRLVPHGFRHTSPRECETWDYPTAMETLGWLEALGLERGWKSPGWQTSDGLYRALAERGYWVAAQEYDRDRFPPGLRVIHPGPYHYHVGGGWGHGGMENALANHVETLANLKGVTFGFIGD